MWLNAESLQPPVIQVLDTSLSSVTLSLSRSPSCHTDCCQHAVSYNVFYCLLDVEHDHCLGMLSPSAVSTDISSLVLQTVVLSDLCSPSIVRHCDCHPRSICLFVTLPIHVYKRFKISECSLHSTQCIKQGMCTVYSENSVANLRYLGNNNNNTQDNVYSAVIMT